MSRRRSGVWIAPLSLVVVAGLVGGCGAGDQPAALTGSTAAALAGGPGAVDILFMVDDSSSMTGMQQKLAQQIQSFVSALETLPGGFPDIHIAVVSSDLGAPGDTTIGIGCSASGDQGVFHASPQACSSTTLEPGSTFISNVGGVANYSGNLADVLACILPLGSAGCGFEHQLASVARALGADGAPPPAANLGFLRPGAELAIVLLTNEDDCSAPGDTTLYSLNGAAQSIKNPLGPIANYRCNQFGHLCKDPNGGTPDVLTPPSLSPPSDATGNPPAVALTDCVSNDGCSGSLTPVVSFANEIMALKTDPSQVVVGAIVAPPGPYMVEWVAPSAPPPGTNGELWPQVMHSCGPAGGDDVNPAGQASTDGTFGDPAVRIAQWVQAFGDNGFTASICDADYGPALQQLVTKIGQHLQPSGATLPPPPTAAPTGGPLATSAACQTAGHGGRGPGPRGGCSAAGGRPGALALALAALGLAGPLRRRRR
jgi:MYXO-CTERM domain-containing protein